MGIVYDLNMLFIFFNFMVTVRKTYHKNIFHSVSNKEFVHLHRGFD